MQEFQPKCFVIPEGYILSPAGREYLNQRKIKFAKAEPTKCAASPAAQGAQGKFTNLETGETLNHKPEHMTHLQDSLLVSKDNPRIIFRGRLDSLQADFVLAQTELNERGKSEKLISELEELLKLLREIMRCDVLNEQLHISSILGLDMGQLRERSHDPKRFYGVELMTLPSYSLGLEYAVLNRLRTAVRETECAAVAAYKHGGVVKRGDIIQALNRLSSAVHIMMCRYLGGQYR